MLNNYEKCSGQSVNFLKSGIFYSANVRRDLQHQLSSVLGVFNDLSNSKYLGLPSLVGRSKKRVFGYLKDKASTRIQSWQPKPISRAGKSVLERNVAQAIPSYTMPCFLLPKTLCQELERKFNNYWWSSGKVERKGLNWLSWRNMSYSKNSGGMGFRDLYGFNIALLGKHCWKFMHNPSSLVSRVFKAKYFPSTTVLKATKGQGSSFIWTGIWQAKEELVKGFRWVLGDGKDIVATKDPWLRQKANFVVEDSHRYAGRSELVSTLVDADTRSWRVNIIQHLFLEEDALAIVNTPIPQREVKDRVAWVSTKTGQYTAKSGYHYWVERNLGSNVIHHHEGWKKIWKLNIPHKLKIFLWHFCRNTMPIRWRIRSRGIIVPITCPLCNNDVEYMLHLFFDCNFAADCWAHANAMQDMTEVEAAPSWLLDKLATASVEELVKISMVLWGIWNWRNRKVWDNKSVTGAFAMDESFKTLTNWREARKIVKSTVPVS